METKNKTIKTIAPVFVILAAVFWGVLVIFIRAFGQAGFGSMEIVSLRMYSSVKQQSSAVQNHNYFRTNLICTRNQSSGSINN